MQTAIKTKQSKVMLTGTGLVVIFTVAHVLTDAVTGSFSALLSTLQARFGLKETTLALLVAALSFSNSMTQPIFGALADRFGRRRVGIAGMVLNAVVLSLVGIIPSVPWLFVLLLVGGLGSAAFHPAVAGLTRTAGEGRRELAVSIFSAGGTTGMALGPVIFLLFVSTWGLDAMPWLMLPGLMMGVMLYRLTVPEGELVEKQSIAASQLRILAGPVGWLSLSAMLSSLAFVAFSSAMPLWLVKVKGLAANDPLIAWTLAAFILAETVGGLAGGALSRKLDRRLLVSGSLLLTLLPLFGIFSTTPGSLTFFGLVMLAGALLNAGGPLLIVSAQDLAPQAVGAASGFMMGFPLGLASLLYIGIGRLQEGLGLQTALEISYLALIPAAMLAAYALKKRRKNEVERKEALPFDEICPCFSN